MRKYALIRVDEGDYLCASNDGATVWRFSIYTDGQEHGLDVNYRNRKFWLAASAPMPSDGLMALGDVEDLSWVARHTMLPTRRAALDAVFGPDA